MAVSATSAPLTGLPRRLVQDGIIDEPTILEAIKAARTEKVGLVAHLVNHGMADARKVAIAASHEFGVPLMDIEVLELELEAVKTVDQTLLNKHRVLPLVLRGKRMFLGVSDPTNLAAIDEIKFQTGCASTRSSSSRTSSRCSSTRRSRPSILRCPASTRTISTSRGWRSAVATRRRTTTSAATTSKTRRSSASSTRSCSTRSSAAPRTSTSSPTRRCSGCAPDSTAC